MMEDVYALAVEVWRSEQVMEARMDVEKMYAADPNAASDLARARISSDVDEYAFAATQAAITDPYRPQFQWFNAWAWKHGATEIPSGRYGTDNPDNFYRYTAIGPGLSYRITGKLSAHPPVAYTFSLYSGNFAETNLIRTIGIVTNKDLQADAEGNFVITIGPQPANGRPNHIQSEDDARMLAVRETLGDWSTEMPAKLAIERIDDLPSPPPASKRELAESAARILREGAPNWALKFQHDSYEKLPFNQPQPIMSSAKRLGGLVTQSSSHGRFAVADDQAYIVRVDPFDADYLGFQLADVWMVSADYVDTLGCLNNFQAVPDADGHFTFVVSRVDPGVHNWLDAKGLDTGGTTIRFQGLKDTSIDHSNAFEAKVVKISQLKDVLPPETVWVTPEERAEQLAERRAAYERRKQALGE